MHLLDIHSAGSRADQLFRRRNSALVRAFTGAACLALAAVPQAVLAQSGAVAPATASARPLHPGDSVERTLATGARDFYSLAVRAR